ncbi:MAG: 3-oxoacyl-ACP reductase FabG [Clostridia bacterium]|jgi:3-oxoacyl-[acyl-carrier protein] reductase|nr:3-oxoacyl-ACP reductase FabG [Clostridia bacterium]
MNKIIIVTGASRGIGREIAKELAKKGHTIIANYNKSEEKILELKKELEENKINIDIFKADVSTRREAQKLVEYTINKYGKIDILINNAGISQFKEFTQITDEDWEKMIKTNLNSVFYMSQEACKNMIHNKKGCIINISSIWGIIGASCEVHYSVSKAGIDAMTKSLAKELGPSNIRVNSIAPGIINTEMNKRLSQEEIQNIKNEIPLEKIGNSIDIERCIEWLIEDEYTTGQIISINGGWA